MRKRCVNCKDVMRWDKKVRLCPVCRRTYGWGAFIGGLVGGIIVKLFT
jgi:RNA polymerase subunit RPABC4/transcription elongation factor Spt4